ncbi:hypothetical protein ACRALDRAFT_205795 [Sodiomyces alcalophilus JCM 7366]|uniref:uncharacterized protein n=1 Tax=Sodiomyces alcalophilus JCM 7366 TaxID=591952 RepID=UPI0039B3C6D4
MRPQYNTYFVSALKLLRLMGYGGKGGRSGGYIWPPYSIDIVGAIGRPKGPRARLKLRRAFVKSRGILHVGTIPHCAFATLCLLFVWGSSLLPLDVFSSPYLTPLMQGLYPPFRVIRASGASREDSVGNIIHRGDCPEAALCWENTKACLVQHSSSNTTYVVHHILALPLAPGTRRHSLSHMGRRAKRCHLPMPLQVAALDRCIMPQGDPCLHYAATSAQPLRCINKVQMRNDKFCHKHQQSMNNPGSRRNPMHWVGNRRRVAGIALRVKDGDLGLSVPTQGFSLYEDNVYMYEHLEECDHLGASRLQVQFCAYKVHYEVHDRCPKSPWFHIWGSPTPQPNCRFDRSTGLDSVDIYSYIQVHALYVVPISVFVHDFAPLSPPQSHASSSQSSLEGGIQRIVIHYTISSSLLCRLEGEPQLEPLIFTVNEATCQCFCHAFLHLVPFPFCERTNAARPGEAAGGISKVFDDALIPFSHSLRSPLTIITTYTRSERGGLIPLAPDSPTGEPLRRRSQLMRYHWGTASLASSFDATSRTHWGTRRLGAVWETRGAQRYVTIGAPLCSIPGVLVLSLPSTLFCPSRCLPPPPLLLSLSHYHQLNFGCLLALTSTTGPAFENMKPEP